MNTPDAIKALTALANTSLNPNQLTDVQNLLRTNPAVWHEFGNLFEWTRNEALNILHPNSVKYQSTIEGIRQLREELRQLGDTALERIAVEQIINCHVQTAKTGFQLESLEPSQEAEPHAKHFCRVHERAQSRLLRSMQVLVRLRKANIDLEIKLRKNRPPHYDKSDYLRITEDTIKARQQHLQTIAQEEYDARIQRNETAREVRRSQATLDQEANKLSLENSWQEFLERKKLEAKVVSKPAKDSFPPLLSTTSKSPRSSKKSNAIRDGENSDPPTSTASNC